jgi:hypothetical protein
MSKSGIRVMTAAAVLLVLASPVAHSLDANNATRYASVDTTAFPHTTPPANTTAITTAIATRNKAPAQKKPKAAKARILTGLHNFRSPARRALDNIKPSDRNCGVGTIACPVGLRNGEDQSQPWSDATLQRPSPDSSDIPLDSVPTYSAPALVRPHSDVPGLVPGRESSYKLSLNLPLGRYENVLVQANLRKNTVNNQNTSDSTLRADWSLRF